MGFIKKYIASIIAFCILIAALLLVFLTMSSGKKLRAQIDSESVAKGKQLISLASKTPSSEQFKQEKEFQAQHKVDSEAVVKASEQTTMRSLLGYQIFPEPADRSDQIFHKFGDRFIEATDGLLKQMGALDAPSDAELEKAIGRSSRNRRRRTDKGSDKLIINAICEDRAASIPVYAGPGAFKWYDFWAEYQFVGRETAIEDCWYSQISFWVYQDVVATIAAINAGSQKVDNSPVKRLVGVGFRNRAELEKSRTSGSGRHRYSAAATDGDRPEYVIDTDVQVLGVYPWTERKGDKDIDVIHFSLSVLVAADSVPAFIKELCSAKEHTFRQGYEEDGQEETYKHNQITVLEYSQSIIDRENNQHDNYRYGKDAVVELKLVCEYIFNRKGYDKVKPKSVKIALEQETAEKPKGRPGGMY